MASGDGQRMDLQVNLTLTMNDCSPNASKTGQNFSQSGK